MDTVLEGYVTRLKLKEELGVCDRTMARYESQPNGLPFVPIGGQKFYRVDAVREWLAKRERSRNQRRVA